VGETRVVRAVSKDLEELEIMFDPLATEAQCRLYQNFSLFIRNFYAMHKTRSAQLMSKATSLRLSALPFRLFWKRVPTSSRPSGRLKAPVLGSAALAPGLCLLHSIDESSDGSIHIETPQ